ncbi:MAG TPA: hypothetical protein VGR69_02885 [Candidatus Rubrimentiphilum sp.]|nr:hypothetical protein [Candidatus Rubrimentiphilum sp.]
MIFPLAAPALVVVLNGSIVRSYNPPYVRNGRVIAPVDPFVTLVAAKIAYSGNMLVISRGDRFAQITLKVRPVPVQWTRTYVAIAPILRTLGLEVAYDPSARRLDIVTPASVLVTPTPFNAAVPLVAPAAVFTPSPQATPRPIVTGKPIPRRTPLPSLCCLH